MLNWFLRNPARFPRQMPPVSADLERIIGSRPDEDPVVREFLGLMYGHVEAWNTAAIASPRPDGKEGLAASRDFNAGGTNALLGLIDAIENARASFRERQKKAAAKVRV